MSGERARCNALSSRLVQNWNRRTAVELDLQRLTIDLDRRRALESRLRELHAEGVLLETQMTQAARALAGAEAM